MRALALVLCVMSGVSIQVSRADTGEVRARHLSDDICAARMMVFGQIADATGPVGDTELWLLDDWKVSADSRKEVTAIRLGTSASNGIVSGSLCLMQTEEYSRWKPGATVRFTLYALRDGYGLGRAVREVATEELLKDASLLGSVPGQPIQWKGKARQGAYVLKVQMQMAPVAR